MFPKIAVRFLLSLCAAFICWQQPATAQEVVNPSPPAKPLPLSSPATSAYNSLSVQPLNIVQQRAMFEAEQRMLRTEWNKWIGHSPARPNLNASYMSNGRQLYFLPQRQQFVNAGATRSWYW